MKKAAPIILNILYSLLGWLICIVQIGSSMTVHFNQGLVIVLAVLQLCVGLFVNLLWYSSVKKKDAEKVRSYKKILSVDCAIIALPYVLVLLLWSIGWF